MKYLFFDCDGVLVDTEAVAAEVVTRWLNQMGCNISEHRFLTEYTGKTFASIFKDLVDKGELLKENWKDDTILKLELTIYEHVKIVDGIEGAMKSLSAYEKAVISNSRASMVKKALETTLLDKHLDTTRIISAERVSTPKPDPAVYLFALNTFNLMPEGVIAIEDSLSGVKAAVNANIPTIGFCGASHLREGHDERLMAAGAAAIAYHADELELLIKKLH